MRNLALEIDNGSGWQWAWLDDDASVTVENVNPIFDTEAGGTFTHSISLDVAHNSHIFGAAADFRGPKIFNLLRKKKARLWIMGYPITGVIHLDSELSVENGRVEIEICSNSKELSELLDGVKCRDVDISDDKIEIGYALPEYIGLHCKAKIDGYIYEPGRGWLRQSSRDRETYYDHNIACPKMVFVDWKGATADGVTLPAKQFYNVQKPYNPNNPAESAFCNIRVCYQKYVKNNDNWDKQRGYSVSEPNRPNSAPCFYVPYWFHKLWQNLGIAEEKDSLLSIADYSRLAFVHFDPQYDWGPTVGINYNRLSGEDQKKHGVAVSAKYASGATYSYENFVNADIDSIEGVDPTNVAWWHIYVSNEKNVELIASKKNSKWPADYEGMLLHKAYANSKNFPKSDAKEILESMQGAFGARYLFNSQMSSISVVLVRDVLRQNTAQELPCVVTSANKTELGTVGFVLKYSDAQDQEINGITKAQNVVGETTSTYDADYGADTTYNYNAYDNVIFFPKSDNASLGIKNDEKTLFQPSDYIVLACNITSTDKHCYVSTVTGNRFRIKVDSDAKDESVLFPSLFQVARCPNYEEGDCSWEAKNDDLVEEVSIPFTPAFENDVNITEEKETYRTNSDASLVQKFAILMDGEIHHNDDDSIIERSYAYGALNLKEVYDYSTNSLGQPKGWHSACHIDVSLHFDMIESYDIDNDGPYFASDTGLTLTINRGSGSDAGLQYYNGNYDGEGGESWYATSGSDAECTIDCIDQYGQPYDYDGKDISYSKETISKEDVPYYINTYFYQSNANLLSAKRVVTYADLRQKGWYVSGDGTSYIPLKSYEYLGWRYLLTPVADDGTILTVSELDSYFNTIKMAAVTSEENIVVSPDKARKKLVVGAEYRTLDEAWAFETFVKELLKVYHEDTTAEINIPSPYGMGHDPNSDTRFALSLVPRAEAENPGYDPTCSKRGYTYSEDGTKVTLKNGTVVPNTRFFPITNIYAQGRGLGDRFYKEYAYWVLNRKILNMQVDATAAVLTGIDMTKKYRIGGVEGFIKDYSYTIDMKEGISNAKINLYYI